MSTWIQWVSFGLAILGSITGIWALVLNHQRTTILKRKEKERLEAKKKAKLRIDRTKEMGSSRMQDKFVIENYGEAEAKNIEVEFYCYDRHNNNEKVKSSPLYGKVASNILSGHTFETIMMITGGSPPPWEVVITWDDDFKIGNKIEITLN